MMCGRQEPSRLEDKSRDSSRSPHCRDGRANGRADNITTSLRRSDPPAAGLLAARQVRRPQPPATRAVEVTVQRQRRDVVGTVGAGPARRAGHLRTDSARTQRSLTIATYRICNGVRKAVTVVGAQLGDVRLDRDPRAGAVLPAPCRQNGARRTTPRRRRPAVGPAVAHASAAVTLRASSNASASVAVDDASASWIRARGRSRCAGASSRARGSCWASTIYGWMVRMSRVSTVMQGRSWRS